MGGRELAEGDLDEGYPDGLALCRMVGKGKRDADI